MDYPEVWIVCPSCHYPLTYSFIPGSTQAHPSIWGFTNEQKRVRLLPRLTVEHQGRQTLVMAWESLTSGEVVEALRDHETLVYRGVFRNGRRIEADQLG